MKTSCFVGLISAVTIPTTWPSRLTSGPPELPGLTAASTWIRPLMTGAAVRASGTTGRGRTRRPRSSSRTARTGCRRCRRRCRSASSSGCRASPRRRSAGRDRAGASAMSSSGCREATIASAVEPSGKVTFDGRCVPDDVERGEDRSLVVDDHARPDRARLAGRIGRGQRALDEDDRGLDGGVDLLAASRRRGLRGEDAGDDVADVTGGQRGRRWTDDAIERDREERGDHPGDERDGSPGAGPRATEAPRPTPRRRWRPRVHLAGHPRADLRTRVQEGGRSDPLRTGPPPERPPPP